MKRGKPFEPGNKHGQGRPKGSKNRAAIEREALFEEFGPAITKKCFTEALKGNNTALRLCMERLLPPAKAPNPQFKLPPIRSADDLMSASAAVLKAMSAGDLSPQEGESFMRVIESCQKLYESHELTTRVQALEQATTESTGTHCSRGVAAVTSDSDIHSEEANDAE